jgi:hypothetical protein
VFVIRDGRVARLDAFGVEDRAAADARFAELAGRKASLLGNRASRTAEEMSRLALAGDWAASNRFLRDDVRYVDHRQVVGGIEASGRDAVVAFRRAAASFDIETVERQTVAVRGDTLALSRAIYQAQGGEVEMLEVFEIDDGGLVTLVECYDPGELDAAVAALDERYGATGNAAVRALDRATGLVMEGRADEAMDIYSADLVMDDHRPLVGGVRLEGPEFEDTANALFRWEYDRVHRTVLGVHGDHIALIHGVYGNASSEIAAILLIEVDDDGRYKRLDVFDADQLAEATAAFEARAGRDAG